VRLKTLPSRYFRPVGFRKDGRPIFPIAGGSEPPNQPPADPPTDPPADPPKDQKPVEATDEHGVGLGFPKETPVDKMTDAEAKMYWRNQAKVANKRVPANLDQMQRDAQAWAEYQKTQKPPEQQQIEAAAEQARAEGRREAAKDSAEALLRVTLQQRGKDVTEVDAIVDPIDFTRFLSQDGKLDTDRVTAFVDKLAPAQSTGGGNGIGQGRFDRHETSRAEAGRTEAQRRGFKPAEPGKSSLLPQNR
jgi:hypothetical protein